jgi:hypothetical protein
VDTFLQTEFQQLFTSFPLKLIKDLLSTQMVIIHYHISCLNRIFLQLIYNTFDVHAAKKLPNHGSLSLQCGRELAGLATEVVSIL